MSRRRRWMCSAGRRGRPPEPGLRVRVHLQDHLRRRRGLLLRELAGQRRLVPKHLSKRTIGPDKVNHLRHVRYLQDADGVRALMASTARSSRRSSTRWTSILTKRLGEYQAATWTDPEGLLHQSRRPDGTATRVVALAKEAGIAMTGAGAAFPYGKDPRDRNIRIAPTFPSPDDVATAIEGLATCVLLAAAEQLLARCSCGRPTGSPFSAFPASTALRSTAIAPPPVRLILITSVHSISW